MYCFELSCGLVEDFFEVFSAFESVSSAFATFDSAASPQASDEPRRAVARALQITVFRSVCMLHAFAECSECQKIINLDETNVPLTDF